MVIQHEIELGEELRLARAFLATRGVLPNGHGRYDDEALAEAISSRGWNLEIKAETDGWTVELAVPQEEGDPLYRVTADDRTDALLRALGITMTWLTEEEEWQRFDADARSHLGMTGEEFLRRWKANDLDYDDPDVAYVAMSRLVG